MISCDLNFFVSEISQTFGSISQTFGSISQTFGSISPTFGSISQTFGSISQTFGSISQTFFPEWGGRGIKIYFLVEKWLRKEFIDIRTF
jgi:hypothetical protein